MRTKLLLVRHGQTSWNQETRLQGHTDIPLDEIGFAQAREVADYCLQFRHEIASVYSSNLQRAMQTAVEISKLVSLSVATYHHLREVSGGIAEGMTKAERDQKFGALPLNERTQRNVPRFPGAEKPVDVFKRVKQCLDEIDGNHRGATVVVVTHAGVIRTLIAEVSDIDLDMVTVPNCAIAEFHYQGPHEKRELVFIEMHKR